MSYYLHNVEMPFCGKNIRFREIKSKEQLALSKANFSIPAENGEPKLYTTFLKKIIFDCVENKEDLKDLNLIEYILFATKLRMVSFGSNLELQLNQENEESGIKTAKIALDLNFFLKNLYDSSSNLIPHYIEMEEMSILLSWPNQTSENYFLGLGSIKSITESLPYFIKSIKIKDNIIDLWSFSFEERENIFDSLPISIRVRVQTELLKALEYQASCDLFGVKQLADYRFSFFNKTYVEILRLFFTFDLKSIYREYYVLGSKKMDLNFVDEMTTTERKVYLSYVEEERASRETSSNQSNNISIGGNTLESLAREFGDSMPN
jgi:hypothetical protein